MPEDELANLPRFESQKHQSYRSPSILHLLKIKEGDLFEKGDCDSHESEKRQKSFESQPKAPTKESDWRNSNSMNSFHNLSVYGDPCQLSQANMRSQNFDIEQQPKFFSGKSVQENYQ